MPTGRFTFFNWAGSVPVRLYDVAPVNWGKSRGRSHRPKSQIHGVQSSGAGQYPSLPSLIRVRQIRARPCCTYCLGRENGRKRKRNGVLRVGGGSRSIGELTSERPIALRRLRRTHPPASGRGCDRPGGGIPGCGKFPRRGRGWRCCRGALAGRRFVP